MNWDPDSSERVTMEVIDFDPKEPVGFLHHFWGKRVCATCGSDIPTTRKSNAIYCSDVCGSRKRHRSWRKNNPKAVSKKRLAENSEVATRILYRTKARAKKQGIQFSITGDDITIPKKCPILGIPIIQVAGRGKGYHPDSPSIDRIRPKMGYVPGNVRIISARANLLKNDATSIELEKILSDVQRLGL